MCNVREDPKTMSRRRYEIQDGAHRHAVASELRAELLEAGDSDLAAKYDVLPIIILSRNVPRTLTIHLATLSNNQNQNFIETTNIDNITLFKRSYEVWSEMVREQIAEIREQEAAQPLTTKTKLSDKDEKKMLADTTWVKYVEDECVKRNKTLQDVYKLSKRSLAVWIATAKGFSDELVEHLANLYEEDVSIYLLVKGFNLFVFEGLVVHSLASVT